MHKSAINGIDTKRFDIPNIQSDTDKLNKRISYIFFFLLIFAIIIISTMFNIAIKTPNDRSIDLFIISSLLLRHPSTVGSGGFVGLSTFATKAVDAI